MTAELNANAKRTLDAIKAWYRQTQAPLQMNRLRKILRKQHSSVTRSLLELEASGLVTRNAQRGKYSDIRLGADEDRKRIAAARIEREHVRYRKHAPATDRPTGNCPAIRRCLNCSKPFKSAGWEDRLCDPCGEHTDAMI